jgi:ketosteroid isomerase-like protein
VNAQDTLKAYELRINQHDFDLLVELIAPDALFWFNDGSYRGIAEIRAAFERTWASFPLEAYWLDQLTWIAEGDVAAACTYRFNWRSGENSGSGRGTTVLAHTNTGWRIVHEHLSRTPQA